MPGKSARDKGNRGERKVTKLYEHLGLESHRVPMSGAASGFPGDVRTRFPDLGGGYRPQWISEVKARAGGWVVLRRWLGNNDELVLLPDGEAPMVVHPWSRWAQVLLRILQLEAEAQHLRKKLKAEAAE
jgi:hypothetical protein